METIAQKNRLLIVCIILLFASFNMTAQNTVSLSSTGGAVSLTFVQPDEAGNPIIQVTDNSKWLNYNTTIAPSITTYSVNVQLESVLPGGMDLQILAGTYQGNGGGSSTSPNMRGTKYSDSPGGVEAPGTPATSITLSLLPQVLIGNIGTYNTGIGAYVGHQLTYTMSISDYSEIRATSSTVNVIFTITQP